MAESERLYQRHDVGHIASEADLAPVGRTLGATPTEQIHVNDLVIQGELAELRVKDQMRARGTKPREEQHRLASSFAFDPQLMAAHAMHSAGGMGDRDITCVLVHGAYPPARTGGSCRSSVPLHARTCQPVDADALRFLLLNPDGVSRHRSCHAIGHHVGRAPHCNDGLSAWPA
jgi:hypothetical protein